MTDNLVALWEIYYIMLNRIKLKLLVHFTSSYTKSRSSNSPPQHNQLFKQCATIQVLDIHK